MQSKTNTTRNARTHHQHPPPHSVPPSRPEASSTQDKRGKGGDVRSSAFPAVLGAVSSKGTFPTGVLGTTGSESISISSSRTKTCSQTKKRGSRANSPNYLDFESTDGRFNSELKADLSTPLSFLPAEPTYSLRCVTTLGHPTYSLRRCYTRK